MEFSNSVSCLIGVFVIGVQSTSLSVLCKHLGVYILCATLRMSEDALIRLENLLSYARKKGWRDKVLAEKIGRSPQQLSDMKNNRKGFGEDLARDIEQKLGLPRYWLDVSHDSEDSQADRMAAAAKQSAEDVASVDRSKFGPMAVHLAMTIDTIKNPAAQAKAFAAAVVAIEQVIGQMGGADKTGQ